MKSRIFPKTRSWFALGAPIELMSPLSVLRILYALAVVIWPVEALAAGWPRENRLWLYVVISAALIVWTWLLAVKNLSPSLCRALAWLATLQVLALVYLGRSTGSAVSMTIFLVPLSAFVALFLGKKAVLGHAICASLGLWLALTADMHSGGAAVAALAVGICMLSASATVRILTASLARQGSVDPDTGLPNGVGLLHRLTSGESGAFAESGGAFVLATVQLAGVDDARQALGYQVGTELLRRAVEDLGQVVPVESVIARVEADELVVAYGLASGETVRSWSNESAGVPQEAEAAGRILAETLVKAIASGRYLVDDVEVLLRAHVGLAYAPWDGSDVAGLVRRASLSARRAASTGRSIATWDGDRDALTADDLTMLADLRVAIDRGELWIAYQPQFDVRGGAISSVEALLRWDSPVHGSVPPGRFIILAERTRLIDLITEWVMNEALDAQVRWRTTGVILPVAVNVSAKTLASPDLTQWILDELESRGLPHSALTIEVTETAAADLLQAVELLSPLHDAGVRVSIDDFGTGYTSLAAIPYLPLDEIKVDMGFVKRAPTSPADEAIVRSVRELAHRLNLATVAEGVEDAVVERLMVEIGFDLLQGFHLAKPMCEAALLDLLKERALRVSTPEPVSPRLTGVAS